MKTQFVILVILIFLVRNLISKRDIKYTTNDHDFISKFNTYHLIKGNNKYYPNMGDTVKIHFKAKNPKTFKLYYTSELQNPIEVVLGMSDSMKCWDEVIIRMSKGEKIYVVCSTDLIYNKQGNDLLPANEDIGFEIELIGFKRKKKQQQQIDL